MPLVKSINVQETKDTENHYCSIFEYTEKDTVKTDKMCELFIRNFQSSQIKSFFKMWTAEKG